MSIKNQIPRYFVVLMSLCLLMTYSCKKDIKGCIDPKATNYNDNANQDDGSCTYLNIGQEYQGGVIFYIDNSGLHGLIAPTSDQSAGIAWDNGQSLHTNALGTTIGSGKANTNAIIAVQGVGSYAAYMCDTLQLNGYNDWFLPSLDELYALYTQDLAGTVLGFTNDLYWSSTEYTNYIAWTVDFSGSLLNDEKTTPHRVRAIRAF